MNLTAILALGLVLGMRHATDVDHVVAISTIVSHKRTLRAAAPVGIAWGLGHTATMLLVGGAIVLFGLVIPPRLGLAMELLAALMLVGLGSSSLWSALRRHAALNGGHAHSLPRRDASDGGRLRGSRAYTLVRPMVVGVVHGLAGSAAIALLVLGTIREPFAAVAYLAVFGAGTVVGMLLVTTALAMPLLVTARRFQRSHHWMGIASGVLSVGLGIFLVYDIGFAHGLF